MPHETLVNPDSASSYKEEHGYKFKLQQGKKATFTIHFSNPKWENAGHVFDLTAGARVAHDNLQHRQPSWDPVGPFASDHEFLIVGSHKDGDWEDDLPWHQSWSREFQTGGFPIKIGFSDSGVPAGNFNDAHVQITVEVA